MTEERGTHFLSEMLKTGIKGEKWPKVTYAIVTIKDRDGRVIYGECFDSSDHQHTEVKLLSDQKFLDKVKTGTVEITITSNYSPCFECAPKLKEFYTNNKSSIKKFTVRFAHPYKTKKSVEPNEDCLKDLKEEGIKLEAMTEKSWFDLLMQVMFDLEPDKVRGRDEETSKQLKRLLKDDSVAVLTQQFKGLEA